MEWKWRTRWSMARRTRQQNRRRLDDKLQLAELDQRASHAHRHRLCGVELVVCVCGLADGEFGLVVLGERKGLAYECRGRSFPFCLGRSRSVLQCGSSILSEFTIICIAACLVAASLSSSTTITITNTSYLFLLLRTQANTFSQAAPHGPQPGPPTPPMPPLSPAGRPRPPALQHPSASGAQADPTATPLTVPAAAAQEAGTAATVQAPSAAQATVGVPGPLALPAPGPKAPGQAGGAAALALLPPGAAGLKVPGALMRRGRPGRAARLALLLPLSSPLP